MISILLEKAWAAATCVTQKFNIFLLTSLPVYILQSKVVVDLTATQPVEKIWPNVTKVSVNTKWFMRKFQRQLVFKLMILPSYLR